MKKIILISYAIMLAMLCKAQHQQYISSSSLVGTKWLCVNQVSDNKAFKFYYTFTKRNMTVQQEGKSFVQSHTYYLTDKIPQSYDKSKVGKPSKGCYLVEYSEKREDMTYYTVKLFNGKTGRLILYKDYDPKRIGSSACDIELTRVKKQR